MSLGFECRAARSPAADLRRFGWRPIYLIPRVCESGASHRGKKL